jgi:hypothetical protein
LGALVAGIEKKYSTGPETWPAGLAGELRGLLAVVAPAAVEAAAADRRAEPTAGHILRLLAAIVRLVKGSADGASGGSGEVASAGEDHAALVAAVDDALRTVASHPRAAVLVPQLDPSIRGHIFLHNMDLFRATVFPLFERYLNLCGTADRTDLVPDQAAKGPADRERDEAVDDMINLTANVAQLYEEILVMLRVLFVQAGANRHFCTLRAHLSLRLLTRADVPRALLAADPCRDFATTLQSLSIDNTLTQDRLATLTAPLTRFSGHPLLADLGLVIDSPALYAGLARAARRKIRLLISAKQLPSTDPVVVGIVRIMNVGRAAATMLSTQVFLEPVEDVNTLRVFLPHLAARMIDEDQEAACGSPPVDALINVLGIDSVARTIMEVHVLQLLPASQPAEIAACCDALAASAGPSGLAGRGSFLTSLVTAVRRCAGSWEAESMAGYRSAVMDRCLVRAVRSTGASVDERSYAQLCFARTALALAEVAPHAELVCQAHLALTGKRHPSKVIRLRTKRSEPPPPTLNEEGVVCVELAADFPAPAEDLVRPLYQELLPLLTPVIPANMDIAFLTRFVEGRTTYAESLKRARFTAGTGATGPSGPSP